MKFLTITYGFRCMTLMVSLLFVLEVAGQVSFSDSNLPIVVISTQNQVIRDEPKITCDMGIIWNEDGRRNSLSDPFNHYEGKIGIEIRGSTSQRYPKKSYGFETRDAQGENRNVSLLGLPPENDWVLYGAYTDKTLVRNAFTYSLYGQMQPWSPRFKYCELIIDEEYMGVYLLVEKIKIDKNRINLPQLTADDDVQDPEAGGYLIRIDNTEDSTITWPSYHQQYLWFQYYDPKHQELNAVQSDYIKAYISNFENVLYGADFDDPLLGYRAWINVGSFIDYMIIQELARPVDGYRSSNYLYIESKGGKLTCGPPWDFELGYGNADYCDAYDYTTWQYEFDWSCFHDHEIPRWWPRLLEDQAFARDLRARWVALRATLLSDAAINIWIDETTSYIEEARIRNFTKWPILGAYVDWNYFIGNTYDEEVNYLKMWFTQRMAYMDTHFPETLFSHNAESFAVFPNPTSGILHVLDPLTEDLDIRLLGIDGRDARFSWSTYQLDLRGNPKGLYILQINGRSTRIVIQ